MINKRPANANENIYYGIIGLVASIVFIFLLPVKHIVIQNYLIINNVIILLLLISILFTFVVYNLRANKNNRDKKDIYKLYENRGAFSFFFCILLIVYLKIFIANLNNDIRIIILFFTFSVIIIIIMILQKRYSLPR